MRVLRLLQELTYGIKILWLEPYLVNLLKTLSQRVVESSEEGEITLSLSVLVNLCYKNLPAMYSLMRSINTKTFLQSVVKTRSQNVNIRVQCCKLLIILEYTNAELMDSNILDVATVTFTNIIPAIENDDVLLLRHIVDFFNDISQNQHFKEVLLTYSKYILIRFLICTTRNFSNSYCRIFLNYKNTWQFRQHFAKSAAFLYNSILLQVCRRCTKYFKELACL